jgi:hypothetical protein
VIGIKYARSVKRTPAVVAAIAPVPSRKMRGSGSVSRHVVWAPFRGGTRERQNATLKPHRTRRVNPSIRTDHAQPTCGSSDWIINGKRTPPKPLPINAIPLARPRRAMNQWATQAMAGVMSKEVPMAVRSEKERRIW